MNICLRIRIPTAAVSSLLLFEFAGSWTAQTWPLHGVHPIPRSRGGPDFMSQPRTVYSAGSHQHFVSLKMVEVATCFDSDLGSVFALISGFKK